MAEDQSREEREHRHRHNQIERAKRGWQLKSRVLMLKICKELSAVIKEISNGIAKAGQKRASNKDTAYHDTVENQRQPKGGKFPSQLSLSFDTVRKFVRIPDLTNSWAKIEK